MEYFTIYNKILINLKYLFKTYTQTRHRNEFKFSQNMSNLSIIILILLCSKSHNILCNDIVDDDTVKSITNMTKSLRENSKHSIVYQYSDTECVVIVTDDNAQNVNKNNCAKGHISPKLISEYNFYLKEYFYNGFVANNDVSAECKKDVFRFSVAMEDKELWAMLMFDSTAKIPSGLLRGNVNQFGDFDECLNIEEPVKGKYFLASLEVSFTRFGLSSKVDSLIHSHRWLTSNLTDPGHRVPRGSTIYWGICLPESCSAQDVQKTFENKLKDHGIKILIEERLGYTKRGGFFQYIFQENMAMQVNKFVFSSLLIVIVLGTIFYSNQKGSNESIIAQMLNCFSLRDNTIIVLDTTLHEEVRGIDGIRALNAFALLLFHKSIAISFMPLINKTSMAETLSMSWAIIGRTAIIYTDSFLLLSGFLSANAMLKDLNRKGKISVLEKMVSRVFRILPNLFFIIMFCTYILPPISSGPLWGLVVNEHSNICRKIMWRNFLFMHNFFGFENMCLTHTHQVGIDMQLFIFTPLIVNLLWTSPRRGGVLMLLLGILSALLRFWTTIEKEYSTVIYFGMPVKKMFDTANYSYILPTHRATIYLMGVGLAYFMTLEKSKIFLTKLQNSLGWTIFTLLGLSAMIGPWHMGQRGYVYKSIDSAVYNAFSPFVWGLFICWVIWATNNHCAGWFGNFLSWRGFRIFSKLSYGVYLTQFPVFFYNVGTMRHSEYYEPQMMFDIPEIMVIMCASFLLAVFVEIPFNNIWKVLAGLQDKSGMRKTLDKVPVQNVQHE